MTSTNHSPNVSLLSGNGKNNSSLSVRFSPLYFAGLLAFGCVSVTNAAIVADAGQASRPSISGGQNGVTIVDINAAGNGGVSHNIFNRFDVDKNGVVLNNSVAGANSQLAGNIAGNANLSGGAASVILNEVNSNNASILNGMIEVGGQQAQVVIANPAGISCSGCGFINANRATLTTGKAEFADGNLQGYRVEKGTIIINGEGMNNSDANYTDLIARYVNVSSELKAKDLKVIVGRNTVSADTSEVTALKMSGSGANIGLDVSVLGGMYAGKITLISTENGVGVRNSGTIGASTSDLVMDVNGVLDNSVGSLKAARNIGIKTTDSVNNTLGQMSAGSGITIDTNKKLFTNTSGTLATNGSVNINSGQMNNTNGLIQAGLLVNVDTNGQTLTNTGRDRGAGIYSGFGITLKTGQLNNNNGLITTSGKSTITSGALDNRNGQIYAFGSSLSDLSMTVNGTLDNRGGEMAAQRNLNLSTTGSLNNSANGKMSAGGAFTLATNKTLLNNSNGLIEAGTALDINSGELNNAQGILQSAKTLSVDTNGKTLTNSGRESGKGIFSGTSTTLTTGQLTNNGGQISSKGNINLYNTNAMYNRDGRIEGDGKLILQSNSLDNNTGGITMGRGSEVRVNTINNNRGVIASKGATDVYAKTLNNNAGVVGGQTVYMEAVTLQNDAGLIYAEGAADIQATTIYNRNSAKFGSEMGQYIEMPDQEGGIVSKGDLSIASQRLYNSDGLVASTNGNVKMEHDSVDNTRGIISAVKDMSLAAGSLNNSKGIVAAKGANTIGINSAFTNAGTISGTEGLDISVYGALTNSGNLLSDKVTRINSQHFNNQRGAVTTGLEGVKLNLTGNYTNNGTVNGPVTKE